MTLERLTLELQKLINEHPELKSENIYFGDKQLSVDYIVRQNDKITLKEEWY